MMDGHDINHLGQIRRNHEAGVYRLSHGHRRDRLLKGTPPCDQPCFSIE